ncbi:MAG TPA: alkaline phosphatase family protein [Solirubrobacterales bacterium]
MSVIGGDDGLGGANAGSCASCGSHLAVDQRYCLSCGERRGALPPPVAEWLSIVPPAAEASGAESSAEPALPVAAAAAEESTLGRYMPEPRAAAIAVMALLAFGVVVGAATGPVARSAGLSPIVVVSEPAPVEEEAEAVEEETEAVEPAPVATASGEEEVSLVPTGSEGTGSLPKTAKKPPLELPEEEVLPPIAHVFAIVLGDSGFETAFGESSPAPYLAKTLAEKGELLSNYYAVAQGDLANEIALVSGQGPTLATAANCPERKDVAPGTLDAVTGQVQGDGCVYSAEIQTLPDLLEVGKKTWKVYAGDPHPEWRSPFSYFHSLTDEPRCPNCEASLDQLGTDLGKEENTPSFSYIVPGACEDGSEAPCEEGKPAGLAAAQPFLETVVPEIEASDAYKKGGLIAITFAQAPQDVAEPDVSACCATPEYPNLPAAPPAPPTNSPVKEAGGGGRVGMLLLSPFVEAGSVNETGYYNHFSFLLSVEELFGLAPPLGYAAEPALTAFDGSVFNLGE